MNGALFRRTLAANRVKLAIIAAGMGLMGTIMPVIYAAFGQEIGEFVETVPILEQMANFGAGNIFTLPGAIALGLTHPFTLLLVGIMAIAFPALSIAGERDTGTLEVTLSRPISRHGLYLTLYVAGLLFVGALILVLLLATTLVTFAIGYADELSTSQLPQLWLGASLLFVAFMSLAFAVSVESDRAAPAIGIPAIFVLLNYLAFAIGSIWPEQQWLQEYSMFNLFKPQDILSSGLALSDVAILVAFSAAFVVLAWWRFPRRDLPAPS